MSDITPNQREVIKVKDSVSGVPFAVKGSSSDGSINVNITSGGGSGTQYAEGATTSPGTGTLAVARYNATPPALTDGELYGLQLDSSGNLKITGSISVGGSTDNSAYTAGSSTGTPAMGFYHSTIDTVTDGRAATVAITSKRAQHINLRNASGTEIGVSGAALVVDGSAVTQPVSASALPLPTGASTSALQTTGNTSLSNVDTNTTNIPNIIGTAASAIPTKLLQIGGSDGTNARAVKVNTSGQLDIRPLTSSDQITIVPSGTQTVSGTITVQQSTASSLKVDLSGTAANATAIKVDGSGVTQPVSFSGQSVAQSGTWNIGTVTTLTGITNNVNTVEVAPTTILNGKKTVTTAGTRVTLASSTTCKSVTIKALSTNTGIIYVGNSSVASTNGLQLLAGESVSLDIANLSTINIDSSVNGEGVTYLGVN